MFRNRFSQTDVPADPSNAKVHDMTRRRLLRLSAGGGLVLLSGGVAWWGGKRTPALFRDSRAVMGTRGTILLAHPSRTMAAAALEAAFADLSEVERRMSRFRTDSDVGRLNAHRDRWLAVAPSTATVLRTALDLAHASDGQFDPCLDRLVSLWGFHDRHYPDRPPDMPPEFRNVGHAFYHGLLHRRTEGKDWFRLTASSPGIDLGGIAKGYAIDRAADRLRQAGVRHALINVGDDMFALGSHPSGAPWRVGIRHPRQPGALLKVLSLRDKAVATSGDYANCFFHHGQRYAHVLDPRTAPRRKPIAA